MTQINLLRTSSTGSSFGDDGVFAGERPTPIARLNRSSLLVGRALKEVVPMLAQAAIIVACVTPFSFDLHPLGILIGAAMLELFSVGIGSLSFALALVSQGQE